MMVLDKFPVPIKNFLTGLILITVFVIGCCALAGAAYFAFWAFIAAFNWAYPVIGGWGFVALVATPFAVRLVASLGAYFNQDFKR